VKVLTIREPFATLISLEIKKIETRSWKTNYRGKIYIHAGLNKDWKKLIADKNLDNIIDNLEFNYGKIICEAELVDCILMTKEYIDDIKKHNYQEYEVGEYKEGRYAWILNNIKVLDKKLEGKGQLGIWNFYK